MRISHDNYSIKAVRQFFMPDAGKGAVTGGAQSILEFQRWLDTGDAQILEAIERYNEEDCVSTLRTSPVAARPPIGSRSDIRDEIPFRALPEDRERPVETEPDEHRGTPRSFDGVGTDWAVTLGHLLDYHRREAKPDWWAYFRATKEDLDDLVDDSEAIAYLDPDGRAAEHRQAVARPHARVPIPGIQAEG